MMSQKNSLCLFSDDHLILKEFKDDKMLLMIASNELQAAYYSNNEEEKHEYVEKALTIINYLRLFNQKIN